MLRRQSILATISCDLRFLARGQGQRLTAEYEAATYKSRTSFGFGDVILIMFRRCSLSERRVSLCSSPYSNLFALWSTLKKGRLRSSEREMNLLRAEHEMNLLRAAILHVSFCTSLIEGSFMFQRALTLSGLISIPFVESRQSRTFPL